MIIIICALYNEAHPIVKALGLRPCQGETSRFKLFCGVEHVVGVCGPGAMNAAILTTLLLERYKGKVELAVNIGSSGLTDKGKKRVDIGEMVLCNGVYSIYEHRAYHPDILFEHTFKEVRLVTVNRIIDRRDKGVDFRRLLAFDMVDMEAYGFMRASEAYLPASRTQVCKIPSDSLETSMVTGQVVRGLVDANIRNFIGLLEVMRGQCPGRAISIRDDGPIQGLLDDPRLSTSMRHRLASLLAYARLNPGARRVVQHWLGRISHEWSKRELNDAISELESRLQWVPCDVGPQ